MTSDARPLRSLLLGAGVLTGCAATPATTSGPGGGPRPHVERCDPAGLTAVLAAADEWARVEPTEVFATTHASTAIERGGLRFAGPSEPVAVLAHSDVRLRIGVETQWATLALWVDPHAVIPALSRAQVVRQAPINTPTSHDAVEVPAGTVGSGPPFAGWLHVSATPPLSFQGWVRDERTPTWRSTPAVAPAGVPYPHEHFLLTDDVGNRVASIHRAPPGHAWLLPDGRVTVVLDNGLRATGWPVQLRAPSRRSIDFDDRDLQGTPRDAVAAGTCLYAAPDGPWVGVAHEGGVVRREQHGAGWQRVSAWWAGELVLYARIDGDRP